MSEFEYVATVVERSPKYVLGLTVEIVSYLDDDALAWWRKINGQTRFTFKQKCFFCSQGEVLYHQLIESILEKNETKATKTFSEMRSYCQKNFEDLTPTERWAHTALQLPGDIGGPKKKEIAKIITSKARGAVLETMCGFNSYFNNSSQIDSVTVIDYCREMLERYKFPKRRRILYNLEKVNRGKKMNFFEDCCFDTIGCWGTNYLSRLKPVFAEFYRILDHGGNVLVLENTHEGYHELVKRYFNPNRCATQLKIVGFNVTITHLRQLKTKWCFGEYYLVEGIK